MPAPCQIDYQTNRWGSYNIGCSFVMMHLKQRDYRWRAKQRNCIQRAAQHLHGFYIHVDVDVKCRGPVIYQPWKWKTLHPVFLPLFTRTGLNVSITGDRGLSSRVINDQHSPTHCRMCRKWGMWGVVHVRVNKTQQNARSEKYLMHVLLSRVRHKFSTHIK